MEGSEILESLLVVMQKRIQDQPSLPLGECSGECNFVSHLLAFRQRRLVGDCGGLGRCCIPTIEGRETSIGNS